MRRRAVWMHGVLAAAAPVLAPLAGTAARSVAGAPGLLRSAALAPFVSAAALSGRQVRAQNAPTLPLPDVRRTLSLRVAYVHNPRLPLLPAARLQRILALATAHLREHFGVTVRFEPPVELPILRLFANLSTRMVQRAEQLRLDPATNEWTIDRLARSLLKDLREEGNLAEQKRFAESFLLNPPADGSDLAFARALVQTQHTLLRHWHELKGADGEPLLGRDRYNEYAYWNLIGSTELPYEVVVTNQLIASAEWEENSVHSAIRGGVSNGVTSESLSARYKLVSVLSTFPFVDDSPQTVRLRGNDTPTEDEANDYMALLLTHELGHQLLHLGHPFGNASCVMTPPTALRFRQWANGLSAGSCRLGSSRANTPGAVKFAGPEVTFR
jgi:hypothetical protein